MMKPCIYKPKISASYATLWAHWGPELNLLLLLVPTTDDTSLMNESAMIRELNIKCDYWEYQKAEIVKVLWTELAQFFFFFILNQYLSPALRTPIS